MEMEEAYSQMSLTQRLMEEIKKLTDQNTQLMSQIARLNRMRQLDEIKISNIKEMNKELMTENESLKAENRAYEEGLQEFEASTKTLDKDLEKDDMDYVSELLGSLRDHLASSVR